MKENSAEITDHNKEEFAKSLANTNKLWAQVDKPREASAEGDVLVELAKLGAKMGNEIRGSAAEKLSFSSFKDKVKENYNPTNDGLNWDQLGQDVAVFFAALPRVEFMYGRRGSLCLRS